MTIPPAVLDLYNARYQQATYSAVRLHLVSLRATNPDHDEGFALHVLNLLTDAALERCGATIFAGREAMLLRLVQPISIALTDLCQRHLDNFPAPPDPIQQLLLTAQHAAEEAAHATSIIRSWRGYVACMWVKAAMHLIQAASAVLVDSTFDSYPREKLGKALHRVHDGISEASMQGFTLPPDFLAWMKRIVSIQ